MTRTLSQELSHARALGDKRRVASVLDWVAEAVRRFEAREQQAGLDEAAGKLSSLDLNDPRVVETLLSQAASDESREHQDLAARLEHAAGAMREQIARQEPIDPRVAELNARMRASGMFIAPDFSGALSEDEAVALALDWLAKQSRTTG